MQSPLGNCFVEYIWPAQGAEAPEVLEKYPFWASEPSAGYFRSLSKLGLKSFYRADRPHQEEILVHGAKRKVVPEAVRLVDEEGKELGRWTFTEEYEDLPYDY